MGFWDSLSTGIFGKGNDLHYQGAHEWIFGGGATKGLNTQLGGYDQAQQTLGQVAGAQAPTVYGQQLNPDQMAQSRAGSYGVANRLGAVASGEQQGAGEMAVNAQVGRAAAQQMAAARAQRGANAALAYRNAQRNAADIGLAGAGQAGAARMQDQATANAQLGQIYGGLYSQDAQVAQQNANLGQQAALANQQAALQNRALQIQATGQQLGWSQAQIDLELKKAGIDAADKGMFAGLLSSGGALMAASDERLKTNIADGGDAADELMSTLNPRTYRYRDEKWGKGNRLGIMAQDLAKSKLGAATLGTVDGKHLGFDVGAAAGAALAAAARLHERLTRLEKGER